MEPPFWPNLGQIPIRNLRRKLKHTQIFWREIGRGQTVIFLHGAWHDGDQWSEVLSMLGGYHHCLAPDLIGFGESTRPADKSTYSITMEVNALAELLESLRLNSVVLVGHSLGAWVAARYALRHPNQVKGLCVLDPEGIVYEPKRWRQERWLASPLGGLWLAITRLIAGKSPGQRKTAWLKKHHLRQLLKRHNAACRLLFKRRRNAIEPELIGSQLTALAIPIVLIQGNTTDSIHQYLAKMFTMATPNAMVQALPNDQQHPNRQAHGLAMFLKDWLPTLEKPV